MFSKKSLIKSVSMSLAGLELLVTIGCSSFVGGRLNPGKDLDIRGPPYKITNRQFTLDSGLVDKNILNAYKRTSNGSHLTILIFQNEEGKYAGMAAYGRTRGMHINTYSTNPEIQVTKTGEVNAPKGYSFKTIK